MALVLKYLIKINRLSRIVSAFIDAMKLDRKHDYNAALSLGYLEVVYGSAALIVRVQGRGVK